MAYLHVDEVSLRYPVTTRSSAGTRHSNAQVESQIEVGPGGRAVAVKALSGVTLRFEEGERGALIGRNGSGKTSLLRVLAGLLPPEGGRLVREGRLTSLININLGIQMQASGHRNITLRGLAAGYSRNEIESVRENIIEFSELGSFLDLPVETYSSGMRMRLVFAIATAFSPDILILDEWISTGDAGFRDKVASRMKRFADSASLVVMASHSEELILDTCPRTVWLDQGHVRMDGPTHEVVALYRRFIAE